MANPVRGDVAFQASEGVDVTLRFTCHALASVQHALGFEHGADGCAKFFERLARPEPGDWFVLVSFGRRSRTVILPAAPVVSRAVAQALALAFPAPSGSTPSKRADTRNRFSWEDFLRSALRAGMTEREFWASTPRQVTRHVSGAFWRQDRAMERTWLNASWARRQRGKMPDLKKFLTDPPTSTKVAPGDSRAFLINLAQAWRSDVSTIDGRVIVQGGNVMPQGLANG